MDAPPTIPRSQLYYWTRLWQAQERETLEEIGAGDCVRFSNPDAAVRWLLADGDEADSLEEYGTGSS